MKRFLTCCWFKAWFLIIANYMVLGVPYVPKEVTAEELSAYYKSREGSNEDHVRYLRSLPAEKKQRYADMLRKFDPEKSWEDRENYADWWRLLILDDEITGQYLLRQFQDRPSTDLALELGNWHSLKTLAPLAKASLIQDVQPEGTPDLATSFACSKMVFEGLKEIPGVPENVKQWALGINQEEKQMYADLLAKQGGVYSKEPGKKVLYRMREIARAWWRANEKALVAGRLEDLKPGEHYQPKRQRENADPINARRIELNPKRNPQTNINPIASVPIQEPAPTPSAANYAIYATVAAIFGAIALFFRKRLLRKQR